MRAFGGIEQVKEECRDARGVRWIEELGQDTRYAVRTLRETPAFAIGAVALLTLAIAANLMVASLLRTLFFNPLPFPASAQLVSLSQEFTTLRAGGARLPFSLPEAIDLENQIRSVEQMAAFHYTAFNATGAETTERVQGATVSPDLFRLLDAQTLQGRVLDSGPARAAMADGIVISERLWHRFYAADPALVGKRVQLDGRSRTVLGIMPAAFEFPLPRFDGLAAQPVRAEIWQSIPPTEARAEDRGSTRAYDLIGRLKEGVTVEELNRELEKVSHGWQKDYGSIYKAGGLQLKAAPFQRGVGERMRSVAFILVVAVLMVWLISAANLSAMFLSRAATARPEMAIRVALGAGPVRLLRQAASEGLLLAVLGSVAGIFLGSLGVVCLRASAAQSSPLLGHLQVTTGVIVTLVGLSLATLFFLGLVPGLYAVRFAITDSLGQSRAGSPPRVRSHQLRDFLVIGETALALVLLVGAGLLTRSFLRLQEVSPGFKAAGVVTMEVALPEAKYPDSGTVADYFSKVAKDAGKLPGIGAAAFVSVLPFGGATSDGSFTIEGGPSAGRTHPPDEEIRSITPDYFRALEIPLRRGRFFASSDTAKSRPVVVVSEALARRYWGTDAVLGKRIKLDYPAGSGWRVVVGVVGDIRHLALDAPAEPEIYLPHTQMSSRRMVMTVRTDRDADEAIPLLRGLIQSLDSQQPVANARTLRQAIANSILPRTFAAALVGLFAVIGLLLAAAGIYAVVSYATVQRRHEFAVRMAVGANRANIIVMVLQESGRLLCAGSLVGCVFAISAALLLRPVLFEVSPLDPVMYLAMLGFIVICGLAAAYLPARRATRHNLASALAHD